jgi:hypothetical protein
MDDDDDDDDDDDQEDSFKLGGRDGITSSDGKRLPHYVHWQPLHPNVNAYRMCMFHFLFCQE